MRRSLSLVLAFTVAVAVADSAIAGIAACGALKLEFNPREKDCFPAEPGEVRVLVQRNGDTLVDFQGPAPEDRYYSTVTGEDQYAGFYFQPDLCKWRVFVGSKEEVIVQLTSEEAGTPYEYPKGVTIQIVSAATGQTGAAAQAAEAGKDSPSNSK